MILFALTGTVIGAILGSQFTVHALIPAAMCALTIGMGSTFLHGGLLGPTVNELAVVLTFLQIGYIVGAAATVIVRGESDTHSQANTDPPSQVRNPSRLH